MIKRNKTLCIAALGSLLLMCIYGFAIDDQFFSADKISMPQISETEAAEIVSQYIEDMSDISIAPEHLSVEWFVNTDAERYLNDHNLRETYEQNDQAPPLAMWDVSFNLDNHYFVDPISGDIIGYLDTVFAEQIVPAGEDASDGLFVANRWIRHMEWDDQFTHVTDVETGDEVMMHQFVSKQPLVDDVKLLLKVYTYDGAFAGYFPKLDIPEAYQTPASITNFRNILAIVVSIAFMGTVFIASLMFIMKHIAKKSITVSFPLVVGIITVVAGGLLLYHNLGIIDGIINGLLVFMALMTVYSKKDRLWDRSINRLASLKEKVVQGFFASIVLLFISSIFYAVAEYIWDMWGSAEDAFLLIKDAKWLFLTPLLVGLYAAITEEVLYRKFGEFLFRKLWNNQVFIVIVTSFIWAVGHLTYNMYPWYIRLIELTIVIGPLLYWIYKRYGLIASITTHYVYNCLSMSLSLITLDTNYIYTLLFLLVPFLILIIPSRIRLHERNSVT